MSEFDFEGDSQIDPHNLHNEWMRQSNLMMKYGREVSRLQKVKDKALEDEKVIRSQIIMEIQKSGEKVTAPIMEAMYRTDNRHITANDVSIRAEYEYNMAMNALMAINAKKNALEGLVKLFGMEYFSVPKEGVKPIKEMSDHIQSHRNEASGEVRGRRRTT